MIAEDFMTPNLLTGKGMFPVVQRLNTKCIADHALQVWVPSELAPTLLNYPNELALAR